MAVLNVTMVGDQQLAARLTAMPDKVHTELKRIITTLVYSLQARVKRKLSGDVLNVITGKLRDSIAVDVQDNQSSIIAKVFSGGEVKYAGIHEFGGTINHPGGTAYFFDKAQGRTVFVKNSNPLADTLPRTAAHAIRMPERSFLRSSLAEMKNQIATDMRAAIVRGTKK